MKYSPSTVAAADISIARKPAMGGEKKLYVSSEAVTPVGELNWEADASGVWTADPITGTLPTAGVDLVLKVEGEVKSNSAVVVTVVGTDQNDAALTGTVTLAPPSYAANRGYDFQEGVAWDVACTTGKKFKTITSVSATYGLKGSKVGIYYLPTAWQDVGCAEDLDAKVGIRPAHNIACGMDGSAFVTRGRSEPSSVTVKTKHFSVADGLNRYAGRQCSLRLDIVKGGTVLTERYIFGNAVLSVDPNFPDGGDEVRDAASGSFEEPFGFFAP